MKKILYVLANRDKAINLLMEDEAKIKRARQLTIEKEARQIEINRLTAYDIEHIKTISMLDIIAPSINLATAYREICRIKNFLGVVCPNLYEYVFGKEYLRMVDTVLLPDKDNDLQPYSLSAIENALSKAEHGTEWPVHPKLLQDTRIRFLYTNVCDDLKKLKKLVELINSYS